MLENVFGAYFFCEDKTIEFFLLNFSMFRCLCREKWGAFEESCFIKKKPKDIEVNFI